MRARAVGLVIGAVGAGIGGGTIRAEVRYTISAVPLPSGTSQSRAAAINDNGWIVGGAFSGVGSPSVGFLAIGPDATPLSFRPSDINNSGQIVGGNTFWNDWATSELLVPDGDIPGTQRGAAVNSAGEVVGVSFFAGLWQPAISHAVRWVGGVATEVIVPKGYEGSHSIAINDNGTIVGTGLPFGGDSPLTQAFLYRDGQFTLLPTPAGNDSGAMAINNNDQVVGTHGKGIAGTIPTLWLGNTMVRLPSLGLLGTTPAAINESGIIVGWANDPVASRGYAVLWDENRNIIDLEMVIPDDSGWSLRAATDINESGQIVGFGYFEGVNRAFLLTPIDAPGIPEPAGLGVVAAAVGMFKRRRLSSPAGR